MHSVCDSRDGWRVLVVDIYAEGGIEKTSPLNTKAASKMGENFLHFEPVPDYIITTVLLKMNFPAIYDSI